MKLQYQLEIENPQTHFVKVTLNIEEFTEDALYATIPAWAPGSYEIYDFSRFVRHLHAFSGKTELEVAKKDKSTWKISTKEVHSVSITYEFYANELSVHTSHVDSTHAYFNGVNLFMYLEGYKDQSVELVIKPYKDWKISTGLEKLSDNKYRAINYDILADCPIEIGTHRSLFFTVDGKEHEIVLYGKGNENEERIKTDLKKIVEGFLKIFGKLPYKRYVFIYHLFSGEADVMGGLEHLNSTTIDVDNFVFSPESKYERTFLSVTAHEYFHLWNVKRIRPIELGPFNYKDENYTSLLWVSEGITNFYAYIILLRCKIIDSEEYFKHISRIFKAYRMIPGTRYESAADSSFDAWIKLYRPSPNSLNSYVSYYLKGEILGFMINSRICEYTKGLKSLDDVFRHMFEKYNKDGKGFTEKDLLSTLSEVSSLDFAPFFAKYVRGTDNIDFTSELKRIGMNLEEKYEGIEDGMNRTPPFLGIIVDADKNTVHSVLEDSPGQKAGISPEDEIVAIGNFKMNSRFLKVLEEKGNPVMIDNLKDYKPGDRIKIHIFRRGELRMVEPTLGEAPKDLYEIKEGVELEDTVLKIREKFLQG